jgi:hypothetical protein
MSCKETALLPPRYPDESLDPSDEMEGLWLVFALVATEGRGGSQAGRIPSVER